MPRKTALTARTQKAILNAIRTGLPIKIACARGGIGTSTYANWLRRGHAGEEPFQSFLEAAELALAEAAELRILRLSAAADAGGAPGVQADTFWLRTVFRDEFAEKVEQETKLSGDLRLELLGRLTPETRASVLRDLEGAGE